MIKNHLLRKRKKYNLTETRAKFMKNYYTYLYGLPMKLNDAGTIINPMVERKSLWERVLGFTSKMKRELGKMFGTFILIQNLCHEDLPVLP
jgi:hypothetical protein